MKIELSVATSEEHQALSNRKGAIKLDTINLLAPLEAFRPGEEGEEAQDDNRPMLAFSKEGLGAHGAYEDTVGERDMFAPGVMPAEFSFLLDYPMNNAALVHVSGGPDEGFSAAKLLEIIREAYQGIYLSEEGEDPAPASQQFGELVILNRPQTQGIFGIWGHGIADLAVEQIEIYRLDNGRYTMDVFIGS
ncbi:hypothetical protein AB9K35_07765 [Leisingera sp. XS_AS12]|uniref:hypothetical protein n=1 Tax=Leisingera sp. XS_AS12 TaxID=3241294 RepID=UPI00351738FF